MPKLQVYAGDGFEVTYDPATCTHAAECVRGLPAVFDAKASPWIRPGAAPLERIAEVVARCPSGALAIRRAGAAAGPSPSAAGAGTSTMAAVVACAPNGPLLLEGAFVVKDASGAVVASGGKVALCRCGQSAKKPFCDGAHRRAGFAG